MMKIDELKKEADALGYKLVKKPCYDCTCVMEYPRVEKCKNYEPIELETKRINSHLTHCRRKNNDT